MRRSKNAQTLVQSQTVRETCEHFWQNWRRTGDHSYSRRCVFCGKSEVKWK